MNYESNESTIIDEIDRLFFIYKKAKEYLERISTNIDQQINLWQYRQQLLMDQFKSSSSSTPVDYFLSKTQRINELAIEAVQSLCRTDLLIGQVVQIDPKSLTQSHQISSARSFSARPMDTNAFIPAMSSAMSRNRQTINSSFNSIKQPAYAESIQSEKTYGQSTLPMPILRPQINRVSSDTPHEQSGFTPIDQPKLSMNSDSTSRPTPIHPQNAFYQTNEGLNSSRMMSSSQDTRISRLDKMQSPLATRLNSQTMTSYQMPPREKVRVKLQRIAPGTKWKEARIDVIDSLSAFYVENLDRKIREKFEQMSDDLHDYYDKLQLSNRLKPLENISIGDFGVAKYCEDGRWYRARIIMCEEHNHIRIVYIDFGNIEVKLINEFFPLYEAFAEPPAQAIACTLSEAFPRMPNEGDSLWPQKTVEIFREAVTGTLVEVSFVGLEEGTNQWPLHFVRITIGNQTVTNLLNLKQYIEPRPNHFIAEQLVRTLRHQEYILFNVPIAEDEVEQ